MPDSSQFPFDVPPTVRPLVRTGPHRSPSGGELTVRRWGRHFVVLDIDLIGGAWPEPAAEVLRPIAFDLAHLALYTRDGPVFVSQFLSTGSLYAPNPVADVLLDVLVAADAGQLTPARLAGPVIRRHVAPVHATRPVWPGKRQFPLRVTREAARGAVAGLVDEWRSSTAVAA